jgi:hypothetical protein
MAADRTLWSFGLAYRSVTNGIYRILEACIETHGNQDDMFENMLCDDEVLGVG